MHWRRCGRWWKGGRQVRLMREVLAGAGAAVLGGLLGCLHTSSI